MGLLGKLLPLLGPGPVQGPPPGGLAPLQGPQLQVVCLGHRPEPLALRPGRLAGHAYPKYVALDLAPLLLLLVLGRP